MTTTITARPIAGGSGNIEWPLELGTAHLSNDVAVYDRAILSTDTANCWNMFRVAVQGEGSAAPRAAVGALMPEQSIAGDQNLPMYYFILRQMRRQAHLSTGTEIMREWSIEPRFVQERNALTASDLPPVVREFAEGADGVRPGREVVAMAGRVVQAAVEYTVGPEIVVDEDDGSLDFHLRLTDGLLVMANLFPDGAIDASVYDDSRGVPVKTVKRMRRATTSAEELINLFREGGCASAS